VPPDDLIERVPVATIHRCSGAVTRTDSLSSRGVLPNVHPTARNSPMPPLGGVEDTPRRIA